MTKIHRHRHEAMATWFELHIAHEDASYAAQASLEAWALVDRIESLLSRFREDSEVSRIGRLAPGETMQLSPLTFDCLRQALDFHIATSGAFDPALGHLQPRGPEEAEPVDPVARGRLVLFPEERAVSRDGDPVKLDLGAIGKGYALDMIARELLEWELPRALLVAGGSSLLALDGPADGQEWEICLTPRQSIWISRISIGASGAAVKGAHIIDSLEGRAIHRYARTWASAATAAAADALSTACMLLDRDEIVELCTRLPHTGALLLADEARAEALECFGDFPPTIYRGK